MHASGQVPPGRGPAPRFGIRAVTIRVLGARIVTAVTPKKERRLRAGAVPDCSGRDDYFFAGSAFLPSAGAIADAGAAAADAPAELSDAFMKSAKGMLLPPFTTAIGSSLPPFIVKIVISAFLRSPLSSNSMWPVAPS